MRTKTVVMTRGLPTQLLFSTNILLHKSLGAHLHFIALLNQLWYDQFQRDARKFTFESSVVKVFVNDLSLICQFHASNYIPE